MTEAVNDDFEFASEDESSAGGLGLSPWQVLIVDDEEEVHRVTHLAIGRERFDGRPLNMLSAYSGAEACTILAQQPNIAIVLLDVVMETEDAGLRVVKYVREQLGNRAVRIVLRTGQPGQAPEHHVIVNYDINDYKEKVELTAQKLFTVVQAGLRSYRDIRSLERNRRGLEAIIEASGSLSDMPSMEAFTSGVLEQLTALLRLDPTAVCCSTDQVAAVSEGPDLRVRAATGAYAAAVGKMAREALPNPVVEQLENAVREQRNIYDGPTLTTYSPAGPSSAAVLHLTDMRHLDDVDLRLSEVFARNAGTSFHNLLLKKDIEGTQEEIVFLLCEAVEARSNETGNHVRRVALYSEMLARGIGLSDSDATLIRLAAPLHDVGKISIPDPVLNKPGKLDPDEWEIMKSHARLGYDLLNKSRRSVLKLGATIALTHHERWDGTGYPYGLKGEEISIFGRIVAVADVYDALGSKRCYKDAWPSEQIFEYMAAQRGLHFDPRLVDYLLDQAGAFFRVRALLPDADD